MTAATMPRRRELFGTVIGLSSPRRRGPIRRGVPSWRGGCRGCRCPSCTKSGGYRSPPARGRQLRDQVTEVAPFQIVLLDQPNLPVANPFLQMFLAANGDIG